MLTDKAILQAKPKDKLYRISDLPGSGLCIEIPPSGSKRWRFRYTFDKKAQMVSLGVYPLISLKDSGHA